MPDIDDAAERPEHLTITLRTPITLGAQTWDHLVLREPTADEWSSITKKEGFDSDIYAVSLISGVPETAVRKMKVSDVNTAAKFVVSFLG